MPTVGDAPLFEKVCLEGFQSGLSWITILRKRPHFRRAFRGFDIDGVARFNRRTVDRLLRDASIVRHRGKIESTLNNARPAIALRDEYGSLAAYFWLQTSFPDEPACWEALRRARWPRGFVCPRCGHRRSSWISTRRLERCGQCRYQCSVTAGTVFHRTRLPLLTWFWAIFFVARHKKGISALQLQRDTGIGSYETAWTLLHKLRSVLRPRARDRLAGLVEADESCVGGPDRRRRGGREVLNQSIVAVAVEDRGPSAGRARLAVLEGVRFERDLGPFLHGVIDARRTTLRTDGFPGYRPLEAAGIRHDRRVQGDNPARAGEILPWSHKIFGNLKTWLRGTLHGVSGKQLPRYLAEFVYRFDRRWREEELFGFVLRRAARGEPLPYQRLVAEPGR